MQMLDEHHKEGHEHDSALDQRHHKNGQAQQASNHRKHRQLGAITTSGLLSIDKTAGGISDLYIIFINYIKINRRVKQLPNGLKIITEIIDD